MKFFLVPSLLTLNTLCMLMAFAPGANKDNSPVKKMFKQRVSPAAGNSYYIIVDKSDYELKVYDEEGWYATYPIVFGSKDLGDKMREGDKRTPNGQFKVIE